jgi:predicted Na+-dependent transporter
METFLSGLLNLAILLFAASSMLSVGFSYTLREVVGPLRNIRGLIRALVANFVLVPLLAWLIVQLLPLDEPLAIGLMLVGMAAGAPFLIKLTEAAAHDVGAAATLLVLLLPVTVAYLPIVVPLVAPGVTVSVLAIASPLVLSMLLPLAIGFLANAWAPTLAQRLRPLMGIISSIALVVLILTTILSNFQAILGLFGSGAILASALLILGAFGIGYVLGGPDTGNRGVLGLGTAQRNIAAATVVATQAIGDPNTLVMVVVTSLVAFAILFPTAWALEKRANARVHDLIDLQLTGRG